MDGASIGPIMVGSIVAGLGILSARRTVHRGCRKHDGK